MYISKCIRPTIDGGKLKEAKNEVLALIYGWRFLRNSTVIMNAVSPVLRNVTKSTGIVKLKGTDFLPYKLD